MRVEICVKKFDFLNARLTFALLFRGFCACQFSCAKSLVFFRKCQVLACILGWRAGRADNRRSRFLALERRCGVKRSEHDKSRLIKKKSDFLAVPVKSDDYRSELSCLAESSLPMTDRRHLHSLTAPTLANIASARLAPKAGIGAG